MTIDQIAAEAAEKQVSALEDRGYLDFDSGEQEDRKSVVDQLTAIIKAAIEKDRELPDERWISEQLFAANTMLQALEVENEQLRAARATK